MKTRFDRWLRAALIGSATALCAGWARPSSRLPRSAAIELTSAPLQSARNALPSWRAAPAALRSALKHGAGCANRPERTCGQVMM